MAVLKAHKVGSHSTAATPVSRAGLAPCGGHCPRTVASAEELRMQHHRVPERRKEGQAGRNVLRRVVGCRALRRKSGDGALAKREVGLRDVQHP